MATFVGESRNAEALKLGLKNKHGREDGDPEKDRNYSLFAILANVRNGHGFAGCDTGDGFVPIALPRGLPTDVSDVVRGESERWGADGHSHSWFTVQELLDYDWTRTTKVRGWLTAEEYWKWSRYDRGQGESPQGYCGGVSGSNVRHVTEAEMQEMLLPYKSWDDQERVRKELASVYCKCEWEQPYYKTVRNFLSDTLPRLLRLGKPYEVRIVFFFDN